MMNQESQSRTVAELAESVGGRVYGDSSVEILRVASLDGAGAGEIAFVDNERFMGAARYSLASCLIVPEGASLAGRCCIESSRPKLAFALVAEILHPPKSFGAYRHPSAVVAASAQIEDAVYLGAFVQVGERTRIGSGTQVRAGAILGDDVQTGSNCVIHPHVTLYDNVRLGDRVILHAGVVVGADGFGYVADERNVRHKFPQIGTVLIEDDVEIGAGSCVDRGALGQTRIGKDTKIDNLVQIGHNVDIGERVVIAAQTGISGSTVIEDDAIIGGQVGFGDHARVLKGAVIGSKAGVLPGKIVRAGVWWGIPVQPLEEYKRLNAHIARVPHMREEIKELKEEIKRLKERLDEK